MADPGRTIRVAISLRTGGIQQRSFSGLLLLMQHAGTQRVEAVTGADQLLDAPFGLTTTDAGYKAAQVAFGQRPAPTEVYIGKRSAGEAADAALAACATQSKAWYGFVEATHAVSDALFCAAWAQANTKLFLTTISQATAITTATESDLASALKANGFTRTAWWYHPEADAFPDVAAAAKAFQALPGSDEWAYQMLAGVPAVNMTETAYLNVKAKNGNTFEPVNNYNLTYRGMTAGSEWIDNIRFADWQCEEVRTSIFNRLIKQRVPYDDFGIKVIDDAIIQALELGRRRGGIMADGVDEDDNIVRGYETWTPREFQVSTSDKAARLLRDVGFRARLRGAILEVEVQGALQYDRLDNALS